MKKAYKPITLLATVLTTLLLNTHALATDHLSANVLNNDIPNITATGKGILENFPTRTVVLLPTSSDSSDRTIMHTITNRTRDVFRYPYYELISPTIDNNIGLMESGQTTPLSLDTKPYPMIKSYLEKIVADTQADIVIKPMLTHWEYYNFNRFLPYRLNRHDDNYDEVYTYVNAKMSIYSYNKSTDEYRVDSASYYKVGDSLSVPSDVEVIDILMDRVLKKLPYKRIPTDIPRYNTDYNKNTADSRNDNNQGTGITPNGLPTLSRNVDSPYNLPRNIQQF